MYSKLFPPRSFNEVYKFKAKNRLYNKSFYFNQNTFLNYYNNKICPPPPIIIFVARPWTKYSVNTLNEALLEICKIG